MSDDARDEATSDAADRPAEDELELGRLLAEAGRRPALPAAELASVREAVRAAWRRRTPGAAPATCTTPRRSRTPWIAALAAGVLVAVGIAWWWSGRPQPPAPVLATLEMVKGDVRLFAAGDARPSPAVGAPLRAGAELRTSAATSGQAGFAALRLAGGGSLRLDAGSRVRLLGPATVALDEGALYADSGVGGAAAGIVVRTPLGDVRELGTQFTVRVAPGAREVRVQVREGAVLAAVGGGEHTARAGEELTVDARGRSARRAIAGVGPRWAWVLAASPAFASEGRMVRDLLDWSARETGWRLHFEDGAERIAASTVLHGEVGALPADRAPFAVLPGAGLEAELRDGTLIVRPAR
jgi:hypothetical protein